MVATHIAKAKASFHSTISALLAFLREPRLIHAPYESAASKIAAGFWLFILSLVITIGFGVLALPFMLMAKAAPGDQLQRALTQSLPSIVVSVILLGPLIEEIIFRGWLTGTWRSFAGSALFLAVVFGGAPLMTKFFGGPLIVKQLILVGLGLFTIWLLAPIDRGARVPGYERAFPFLFWGQGIVFGVLHYHNVAADSAIISLLSTLPLIACGWLWGYARIALGLKGAVMLHAAYNVPAAFGTIILMMMHPA